MEKQANFKKRMAELKGIGDIVSEEVRPAPSDKELNELREMVGKKAQNSAPAFEKKASRNMLDVYADLASLVKAQLEVDDMKAREITSTIVSKSIPLQEKYGLSLTAASSLILEEVKKQYPVGKLEVDKGLTSYQKQDDKIFFGVQNKLKENFDITQPEAELYTRLVKEVVRDQEIRYRGTPKEVLADAIVNIAIKSGDITTIRGVKSSPFLDNALRMELAEC